MAKQAGLYKGRHYTTYVSEIKALKGAKKYDEAEKLLLEIIDVVEAEARAKKWAVAPGYYEHLAIVYRKRKEYQKEIAIIDRYIAQQDALGVRHDPSSFLDRREKAQALLSKAKQNT